MPVFTIEFNAIVESVLQATREPVGVYFLGSGELGVPVLRALHASPAVNLVGLGTQPDRPGGRHRHLQSTPVGEAADALGLNPDKPASVNTGEFLNHLRKLSPELVLVVAFGQILRRELLDLPPLGCMNVHASALPRYRGASPIQAAILSGDAETGVTFMRMDEGLDTGDIYEIVKMPLNGRETTRQLEQRLAELAGERIVRVVTELAAGRLVRIPQNEAEASYAGKINKAQGEVDWSLPAAEIDAQVRAFIPWPQSWFYVPARKGRRRIQITAASVEAENRGSYCPGEIVQAGKAGWTVACGQGCLNILRVLPEGRPEMTSEEFLRGARIAAGDVLPGPGSD